MNDSHHDPNTGVPPVPQPLNIPTGLESADSLPSSPKQKPASDASQRCGSYLEMADHPAEFPEGFWVSVDYFLRNPGCVLHSLAMDHQLWQLAKRLLTISIVMSALYGAVMGGSNLLQGADAPLKHKLAMVLVTAIKIPILFLLTGVVVLPPIYVSNTFVGSRFSFRQTVTLLLAAVTLTVTVLASMASVAFFLSLTTRSYNFIKLLHVAFFAYAGVVGVRYLERCVSSVVHQVRKRFPAFLLVMWLLMYAFVGTQLAWVLRPYMGAPGQDFELFRERDGNFYECVWRSAIGMMSETKGAKQENRQ